MRKKLKMSKMVLKVRRARSITLLSTKILNQRMKERMKLEKILLLEREMMLISVEMARKLRSNS
jgi:hypothetical protein